MNKSLIDTDILSFFIKGDIQIAHKFIEYNKYHSKISISLITYYEILSGLEFKKAEKQKARYLEFIKNKCKIINPTKESTTISAKYYSVLRSKGVIIGIADLLIAGTAISNKLQLVSNNEKHYKLIDEIQLVNWKKTI